MMVVNIRNDYRDCHVFCRDSSLILAIFFKNIAVILAIFAVIFYCP